MPTSNLKLFLAIILSVVLFFGGKYVIEKPEVISPNNLISYGKNILSNIKLPSFKITNLLTLKKNQNNFNINQQEKTSDSFMLPTVNTPTKPIYFLPSLIPSPTIKILKPTANPTTTLTSNNNNYYPTEIIKPSKKPKPTDTPKPSPIISDQRPGSTLEEIFREVSKRECVPYGLLRAFHQQETGSYLPFNISSSTVKIYNKYGWWIDGTGDPCYGLGYDTLTGKVPQDSIKAGFQCRNSIGNQTYDQQIMGLFQISKYEQESSYKYLKDTFPKNFDRRVFFDNAMIFARITKNRVGNPPSNCEDWPLDIIKKVAEKHHGACKYNYGNGNSGDYCQQVLNYYKQYK